MDLYYDLFYWVLNFHNFIVVVYFKILEIHIKLTKTVTQNIQVFLDQILVFSFFKFFLAIFCLQ